MFSFHKPKIYRSNLGCCICRAKSSSSRFTDSKKYEPEFEKCFRVAEKRSGEICNACVLLVKRYKKLPPNTTRSWSHVVDARAGPGTKSFKNKPIGEPKKRSLKPLCKDAKVRHQSMTSSESESEEDEEEMIDELDSLVDPPSSPLDGQRSLRRSTRLNTSPGGSNLLRYKNSSGSATDRNNNFNSNAKNGLAKRRSHLRPEHFFSFLDTSFWQKKEVCCGVIFKGPNNEVIIYPELLTPCGCRKQSRPFTLSTASLSSSSENESTNCLAASKPPSLVSAASVAISPANSIFSAPNNISLTKSFTESTNKKSALLHQDSFTSSDGLSEQESSSSHDDLLDDQSSGISSMAALDEASMMVPDSDMSSSISDRLSTVSSMCLLMDADDGSSNASTATYDGLTHHELEMASDESSPVKNTSDSVVQLTTLAPSAVC